MKRCSTCHESKELDQFNIERARKDGRNGVCRVCSNARSKRNYKANPDKHKALVAKNRVRYNTEVQAYLVSYLLQHPCVECSEADIRCLDFDHINKDKEFDISRAVGIRTSLQKLMKEITKCQVLCANCHRKKSHKEWNSFKHKHYTRS